MERHELDRRAEDLAARDPMLRLPKALQAVQRGGPGASPSKHLAGCQKLLALAQVACIAHPEALRSPLLLHSQAELAQAYRRMGCLPQAVQHASESLAGAEEALEEGLLDAGEHAEVLKLRHECLRMSAELQLEMYSARGSRTCLELSLSYFHAAFPQLAELAAADVAADAGLPEHICDLFEQDSCLAWSVGLRYAHLGREQLVMLQRMQRQAADLSTAIAATQRQQDRALDGTELHEKTSKDLSALSAKRAGVDSAVAPTADAVKHALDLAVHILYGYKDSVAAAQQPLCLQPVHTAITRPGSGCSPGGCGASLQDVWHLVNGALVDLATLHHVCASVKESLAHASTRRQACSGALLESSPEALRDSAGKLLQEVLASRHECPSALSNALAGRVRRLQRLGTADA